VRRQVGVGAVQRGPVRGGGLHDGAHVREVAHELLAAATVHVPADDVGVQQVPVAARPDEGAALLAGVDEPLAHQDLQRLPHHGDAHAQLVADGPDVERRALGQSPTPEQQERGAKPSFSTS
jgi:hypothetical protein